MEAPDKIDESLSKLILLAQMSAAKGDGAHQLSAFKTISDALDNLSGLEALDSSHIFACVRLLKMTISLQQTMVKCEEIPQKEIPQLYHITRTLNTLFVRSAGTAVRSGDTAGITNQCEALLQALDDLRSDASLRTCGILDARLKDAVGRLREKADIMTLFEGEESLKFARVISNAETALDKEDLLEIGQTYAKLDQLNIRLKQKYPLKSNLTQYLVKFRDTFLEKIKERLTHLKKEMGKASLSRCHEMIREMTDLEALTQFHGDASLGRQIRVLKNKLLNEKSMPLESLIDEMAAFIRKSRQDHFAMGFQDRYIKAHIEDEIFTPAFYTHTLKTLEPRKAVSLLREKQMLIKGVDIDTAGQADYEAGLRKKFARLILGFDDSALFNRKKGS